MATLTLRIPGLQPGQEEKIEAVIRAFPGVYAVVVSQAEERAEVDIEDDEVDYETILERVRQAGFEARLTG